MTITANAEKVLAHNAIIEQLVEALQHIAHAARIEAISPGSFDEPLDEYAQRVALEAIAKVQFLNP